MIDRMVIVFKMEKSMEGYCIAESLEQLRIL